MSEKEEKNSSSGNAEKEVVGSGQYGREMCRYDEREGSEKRRIEWEKNK